MLSQPQTLSLAVNSSKHSEENLLSIATSSKCYRTTCKWYELGCITMDVFVQNKTYLSKIFYCPQQQEI
jgi:hypothetical protein